MRGVNVSAEQHIQEAADFRSCTKGLIEAGRFLHSKGWVPATSGNFSARVNSEHFAITVSGRHKGELTEQDVMTVDRVGCPVATDKRPSAETLLHTALYNRYPQVGAVLHTHSVKATLLSRLNKGELVFEDYELLKAFEGISSHEERIVVPIFANDQDIPRLSLQVEHYIDTHPAVHGYLIAGHGLYTWGSTMRDTLRHIEAFEFLFECELTMQGIPSR
jgi:methylthioribulose-1-phosphate dehydratase